MRRQHEARQRPGNMAGAGAGFADFVTRSPTPARHQTHEARVCLRPSLQAAETAVSGFDWRPKDIPCEKISRSSAHHLLFEDLAPGPIFLGVDLAPGQAFLEDVERRQLARPRILPDTAL